MWVRATRLFLLALLGGCYVEMSAGAYRVVDGRDAPDWGYSVGLTAGVYIEPGPVHVGLGYGGHQTRLVHQGDGPPSVQRHGRVFKSASLNLDVRLSDWIWLASAFSVHVGDDALEVDIIDSHVDLPAIRFPARVYTTFLGIAAKPQFTDGALPLGLRFAIGPAVVVSRSDGFGDTVGVGGQVRYAIYGVPDMSRLGAIGNLWRHGYDAERERRAYDRMMQDHERDRQNTRESQCVGRDDCRLVPR